MTDNLSWTLTVEEDPKTGDAIIQFPPKLLEKAGWKEGDTLEWTDLNDGSWSLTKKEKSATITEEVTPEEEEAWRDLEKKQSKD